MHQPTLRLFLIRHGETIDNVAHLFTYSNSPLRAGYRDSPLTNHGVLQCDRLALHFAQTGVRFHKIFSSDLQRARQTAEAVLKKQVFAAGTGPPEPELSVIQLECLREKNFGSLEGKDFRNWRSEKPAEKQGVEVAKVHSTSAATVKVSDEGLRSGAVHAAAADFEEPESSESVQSRARSFLEAHVWPLLEHGQAQSVNSAEDGQQSREAPLAIAVVSHGLLLNALWASLRSFFPTRQLSASAMAATQAKADRTGFSSADSASWDNTGYMELTILSPLNTHGRNPDIDKSRPASMTSSPGDMRRPRNLDGHVLVVEAKNRKEHLDGLKRTKGKIGSAKHDPKQAKMETFFGAKRKAPEKGDGDVDERGVKKTRDDGDG